MSYAVAASGALAKMKTALDADTPSYAIPLGEQQVAMNELLGKQLRLRWLGDINCTHCGRATRKSFNQGYCYPCFTRLAQCDICIVSPEKCHFHLGTCREPEWGERFCMTDHIVYLANSSKPKVGITRLSQVPTRWIDQGAIQALPVFRVATRQQSGLVETAFKPFVADKTSWQAMLKGEPAPVDLLALREQLLEDTRAAVDDIQSAHGLQAIQAIDDAPLYEIRYPVLEYPTKVKAHNLEKTPEVEGQLLGIKGQYLILDTGVINIRKYTAYQVELAVA
ncbi:DUF2797 domain-containing protein [Marinimicrobium alkaliphilum]|uniref:DUF2797 domain-containing protein n=1 Tax=Marinimicrobium alkaliphilum TaxID=2202654 RepID=UPI001E2DBBEB|nr:DUF2797 domain-containing protein [Marinimicrobium alkaliphilum]